MKRAIIIGCGYTGQALARRLLGAGIQVAGTWSGSPAEQQQIEGVKLYPLDLLSPGGPEGSGAPQPLALPAAAGAVVYYMVSTLYRQYEEQARPHLAPLERVLDGLQGQSISGLIYLSSTSVYGDTGGQWIDEQSPVAPQSPWGRMRVDLEQRVWAYGRQQGIPACVVRLPEIYGPGRGPVARLRRGYVLRFPERYSNRIHVEDLAWVLHELGQRLEPNLLLAADDCPVIAAEVYQYAAELLGMDPVVRGDAVTKDPNRRALLSESKRCCNALLSTWLGRPLRYPSFREGLPTTLP